MTVTVTSLGTGVTRASVDQSVKLSAVLNTPSSASQAKSVDATAAVAVDTTPLNDTATLRVQSVNIAYSSTKLDVLDSGTTQVLRILGQLQSLATRATLPGLTESERTVLNGQFQALKIAINNVPPAPPGSEFTAAALLGSLAADVPEQDADATVGGFKVENFFSDDANLLSDDAAQAVLASIAQGSAKIVAQRETIGRLQGVTEFAGASVDAALENQEAANASFDDAGAPSLAAVLQQQTQASVAAQTSRLPANILGLLNQ